MVKFNEGALQLEGQKAETLDDSDLATPESGGATCYMHSVFKEGLRRLEEVYEQHGQDGQMGWRPRCLLIYGDTNNGKTTLARWFQRLRQEDADINQERHIPVVYVQAPPEPNIGLLLDGILEGMNAISKPSWTAPRKHRQIRELMNGSLGVRMLIVDEGQHALDGTRRERDIFLNTLKYFSNEFLIPVVLIGVTKIKRMVQDDQQLGNRFEPFPMTGWKADKPFGNFIIQVLRMEGFEVGSIKGSEIKTIHRLTGGLTGETIAFLRKVADIAKANGLTRIDQDLLKMATRDWQSPNERRDAV